MSQNQQPLPSGSTVIQASKRARQEDNLTVPTTNTPVISPATSFTDVNVNSEAIALNNNTLIYYKTLRKIERGILKANHHKNFLTSHLDKGTTPRGLQANITSQIPDISPSFQIQWETAHLNFSTALTTLLRDYWSNRLVNLRQQKTTLMDEVNTKCSE